MFDDHILHHGWHPQLSAQIFDELISIVGKILWTSSLNWSEQIFCQVGMENQWGFHGQPLPEALPMLDQWYPAEQAPWSGRAGTRQGELTTPGLFPFTSRLVIKHGRKYMWMLNMVKLWCFSWASFPRLPEVIWHSTMQLSNILWVDGMNVWSRLSCLAGWLGLKNNYWPTMENRPFEFFENSVFERLVICCLQEFTRGY